MAKPELSLIEERDETQRALGCVGLSAFAHVGLLIAILLAPSFKESTGVATGTTAGIELSGESIADAAPAGLPQAASATDSSAPVEVLLADANDPNAVPLPNTKTEDKSQAADRQPVEPMKAPQTVEPVAKKEILRPKAMIAKTAKSKAAAKPVVESSDIADALTQARAEAAAIESEAEQKEEAVPLQVALPESESLTQAQANALQAPDAKPIETVQSASSNSAPTHGLPGSLGANGTISGTTQSRGGTAGVGVPYGVQVRDARTLQAMPGNPLPTYPLPDRIANREGTTVLIGHVSHDGRIENVTLEKSSGSRLMDQSAANAFSQWKYRPGQEGYVRLPMQFKLVGDARVIPAQLNRQ